MNKWQITVLNGTSSSKPDSPRLEDQCGKGDRKNVSERWWMTPRKLCLPDATGPRHPWTHRDCDSIHKTHTGPNQTKSQHTDGREHWVRPTQEAICSEHLMGEEKSVFSNKVSLGVLATLQFRPYDQEPLVNTDERQGALLWWFCFIFGKIVVFFDLLFVLISFFQRLFLFWERARTWVGWVGR